MFDFAFLINPVSGGGVGREVFHQLGEILDSFGMERNAWTAALTDRERLAEQTDELLLASHKLIAVGGDGTLAVVLDRVRHLQPATIIGLIPLGTGNDLGRVLGIYRVYGAKGLIACLKQLLKAPSQPFDLWDVNGRTTLVSYLSAGLDASVLRSFDQARKLGRVRWGLLGNWSYYLFAFFSHCGYRLPEKATARIETREGTVDIPLKGRRSFLLANINSYAAGAHPFPGSRFDDGFLEVGIFTSLWKYGLITAGTRLVPAFARLLPRYYASRISLTLPSGTPLQIDGEDLTSLVSENPEITISFGTRVNLLDLRRSFYALF